MRRKREHAEVLKSIARRIRAYHRQTNREEYTDVGDTWLNFEIILNECNEALGKKRVNL